MRRMNAIAITAFAATAALVTLGGCKSDDPFPGQGVTKEYRSYIPKTASKVAEGTGSVKYTATQQGTVFLVDRNRHRACVAPRARGPQCRACDAPARPHAKTRKNCGGSKTREPDQTAPELVLSR